MDYKFKKVLLSTAIIGGVLAAITTVDACSGFIIGKALTADGSFLFGRTEDYPYRHGKTGTEPKQHTHNKNFIVNPAKDYPNGEVFEDAATGFTYPHLEHEYKYTSVADNTRDTQEGIFDEHGFNEYGVSMTATLTATPRDDVLAVDPLVEDGIAESGMTTVILPKIKTAREGVELLAKILDTQGSAEGNNIIFADRNELWYMEIYSGHQYVAYKYPADKFSIMPNTYFLGTVDLDDTANVIHSKGIVETAKQAGSYREKDGKMHLALSYAPELDDRDRSRQYAGIKLLNPEAKITYSDEYYEFLQDSPRKDYTAKDGIAVQRNRFETLKEEGFKPVDEVPGYDFYNDYTPWDNLRNNKDLTDEEKAKYKYPPGNENVVDPHVYQISQELPATLGGTMWLGLSRSRNTPYVPYFGSINDTFEAYQVRGEDYSPDSWYWVADHIDKMVTEHRDLFGTTIKDNWLEVEQLLSDYHNKLIEQYKGTSDAYVAATADQYTANSKKVAEEVFKLMKTAESSLEAAIKEQQKLPENFLDLTSLKNTLATLTVREATENEKVMIPTPETTPNTSTEIQPGSTSEEHGDSSTEEHAGSATGEESTPTITLETPHDSDTTTEHPESDTEATSPTPPETSTIEQTMLQGTQESSAEEEAAPSSDTLETPTTETMPTPTTHKGTALPNTGVEENMMALGVSMSAFLAAIGIALPKIKKSK